MNLHHFDPSTDPVEIADHIDRFGYAIVDRLADPGLLDRLAAEVTPSVEGSATGRDDYDGRHTRRTGALVARSPAARELVMDPLVVTAVRQFLSHASAVQLHLTQIITIGPGETQQHLHRDQMAFDLYPFPTDYHVQCNTIWALTDFTGENGATHICPGTSGMTNAEAVRTASLQAEMERGSVLFYEGKVLHGGGANRSDAARQGVNITYSVGWVRQEENQFLACPPDVARTLDDDLLRMMGYQQGAFALGYVGDQLDPLAVLRGTENKTRLISEFADNSDAYQTFVDEVGGTEARAGDS
jgi:ectoine hydroxylase-related dioxygenase (phytanoyl-CoA dioxygenase family)